MIYKFFLVNLFEKKLDYIILAIKFYIEHNQLTHLLQNYTLYIAILQLHHNPRNLYDELPLRRK